ncbi:MAG: hypothetical protein ABIO57_02655 [Candidatus Paceibacterota bacterium]
MIGKFRVLFWLGIVMLFLPFFGISNTWKTVIAVLIGVALITLAVLLRNSYRALRIIIRNLEHSVVHTTMGTASSEQTHE